jgi:hypothetical protein
MSQQPYHIYLDLDVLNNSVASGAKPQHLVFEETRNTPFLDGDASEYFCSIVRFSIQTGNSLPVFIPRIDNAQVGTYNPNETVYKISLLTSSTFVTRAVEYVPSMSVEPWNKFGLSAQQDTKSYANNDYYYVKNYQDWIKMVNKTFVTCLNALRQKSGNTYNTTMPPFLELDPSTLRCTLNVDYLNFIEPFAINIYFNSRLFELFAGFQHLFVTSEGDLNYLIRLENQKGANLNRISNPATLNSPAVQTTYAQMYQEISTVSLWNPVASIVFCSSMLPIYPTQTSKPKIISNESNVFSNNRDNSNLPNILSDFEIAIQDTNSYRPFILYSPQSEYRLMDMYSSANLNRINISVFWKDHFGNLNPFYLDVGCSAHLKLMFRRKDFYVAG